MITRLSQGASGRWWWTLAVALALGQAMPAMAEEPEARPRLVVIDLEPAGVPEEIARAFTETLATRVDRSGVFDTVSPVQLSAVVALDRSRWATGACAQEDCFARLAKAVDADYAVGGSLARAGEVFTLSLVLVDVETAEALRRVERQDAQISSLLKAAREATVELLQPVLSERSGFVRLGSNVPGVQLSVDGVRSPQRMGQVFSLAAGPHIIRGSREGFYPAAADVMVRPGRLSDLQLTLVPAPETVAAYESNAHLLRNLAWITGGVALASGIAAAVFYEQSSQNLDAVESFRGLSSLEQSRTPRPIDDRNNFNTHQGLYLTFLGTAVASGLTSIGLFVFGPDPGRFAEFQDLSRKAQP